MESSECKPNEGNGGDGATGRTVEEAPALGEARVRQARGQALHVRAHALEVRVAVHHHYAQRHRCAHTPTQLPLLGWGEWKCIRKRVQLESDAIDNSVCERIHSSLFTLSLCSANKGAHRFFGFGLCGRKPGINLR